MRIKNIETNVVVELELRDKNGTNWINDYIGNNGGFGAIDEGLIDYDPDTGLYLADQETIDWWVTIVARQEKIDHQITEIRNENGDDIVDQLINDGSDGDLESTINGQEFAIKQFLAEK